MRKAFPCHAHVVIEFRFKFKIIQLRTGAVFLVREVHRATIQVSVTHEVQRHAVTSVAGEEQLVVTGRGHCKAGKDSQSQSGKLFSRTKQAR